ncbi:MAG: sulfite exporter TauE/SafE family protein [Pyrinomonadaceae bacterium]
MPNEFILIAVLIFVAAMLYASVGHGGASGYLAVMALFSFAPATMRPTALILNICVSAIAAFKFTRKGFFSWRKFYPFAITSIPFAYLGGSVSLPTPLFKTIVGFALLIAAVLLARREKINDDVEQATADVETISLPAALPCGAGLGLLSGLTGVGGGIFLSPVLLFLKWADVRQTAAISAMFILVNSIAGLSANLSQTNMETLPPASFLASLAIVAVFGGTIGASFGTNRRRSSLVLRRLLAVVLVVAGLKMILG